MLLYKRRAYIIPLKIKMSTPRRVDIFRGDYATILPKLRSYS